MTPPRRDATPAGGSGGKRRSPKPPPPKRSSKSTSSRQGTGRAARRDEPPRRDQQARQPHEPRSPRQPQGSAGRQGLGGEQVEGRQAVLELVVASRRRIHEIWIAEGTDDHPIVAEILDRADAGRIPLRRVSRAQLDTVSVTEAPQGVIARAEALPEADLEALARPRRAADGSRTPPFLLALDGVTDPHNLGALLRTADLSGATGVVVPRHRSAHITPSAAKAAAGAVEHVPIALVAGLPAALARLKTLGVWVVGLDASADQAIWELDVATEPIALVFGSEGKGLSDLTKKRCDLLVTIPQLGHLGSLNVSAAGAVACFEVARRRFYDPIARPTTPP